MKVGLRCGNEKCKATWMQAEDDLHFVIDFYEQRIYMICPLCKHESEIDMKTWQKAQESSGLPKMRTM